MAGLPAHCSKCGLTFLTPDWFAGSASIQMTGNTINCPRPGCGGLAMIGDGIYNLRDSRIAGVDGPPLAMQMLERLRGVADRARIRAKQGTAEAEQILAEVADVSPELAEKLRANHSVPAFVLILILIWLIKSVELNVTVDLNHFFDQAYHLYQGEDPESHLDDPPPERSKQPQQSPSNSTDRIAGPPSRQVRRRQEAQLRKRLKRPKRL
jgi:hypothetical protein